MSEKAINVQVVPRDAVKSHRARMLTSVSVDFHRPYNVSLLILRAHTNPQARVRREFLVDVRFAADDLGLPTEREGERR